MQGSGQMRRRRVTSQVWGLVDLWREYISIFDTQYGLAPGSWVAGIFVEDLGGRSYWRAGFSGLVFYFCEIHFLSFFRGGPGPSEEGSMNMLPSSEGPGL